MRAEPSALDRLADALAHRRVAADAAEEAARRHTRLGEFEHAVARLRAEVDRVDREHGENMAARAQGGGAGERLRQDVARRILAKWKE